MESAEVCGARVSDDAAGNRRAAAADLAAAFGVVAFVCGGLFFRYMKNGFRTRSKERSQGSYTASAS